MDKYTRRFFFEAIERLLESRPIEKLKPCLLYLAEDGLPTLLDASGNKAVGNLLGLLESVYGFLGEGSPTPAAPDTATAGREYDGWSNPDECLPVLRPRNPQCG